MKPIIIHTHFHKRKTGVTLSIENIINHFKPTHKAYVFGYGITAPKISFFNLLKIVFSKNQLVTIHCHRNNEILFALALKLLGAKFKLIATRHSETVPSGLTKTLLKKADIVVSLTKIVQDLLGFPSEVIGHGVDTEKYTPNKDSLVIETITQKKIISCIGRVRPKKGQKTLIKAIAPILKKYPEWAVLIVGKNDDSSFYKELQEIVNENNITSQVYFKPETRNILAVYTNSSIVVVPSYSEGFSLVCIEAMSCGCTVIATSNTGVHSEVITNSVNGYLFDKGNDNQLREIIKDLLNNDLPETGKNARNHIIDNWAIQNEVNGLKNIY